MRSFRAALLRWFKTHGKDYPWRRTRDPYALLVSEVMLQQTQIATVLGKGYYTRFLEEFPSVVDLAGASDERLLKAWEGLGYYRRARMLRETARAVVDRHGGEFPQELGALCDLPGIGPYTAGALRAFSFGLPAVLVDGNVVRVVARMMDFAGVADAGPGAKQIDRWAAELADDGNPRAYHAALMELGQTFCRPKLVECLECPVASHCATRDPLALPVKKPRVKVTKVDEHALWLRDANGRVLLHHESGPRRTGLWKLPLRDGGDLAGLPVMAEMSYAITRYRVRMVVHDGCGTAVQPVEGDSWVDPEDIGGLAMAAPFRKMVERLLDGS